MVEELILRTKLSNKASNSIIGDDDFSKPYWKRRPSEIRGYQRALYTNTSDGDYIRVDYNLKDKKVRLYLEDHTEGGIQYYSVIHDGRITVERNLTNGRSLSLQAKFKPIASIIATVPNKEILKIIGKCYGVSSSISDIKSSDRQKTIEKTRRRYFRREEDRKQIDIGDFHHSKKYSLWDALDIALSCLVAYFIYWQNFNFYVVGTFLGLSGLVMGAIDILVRDREPIFTKILLLVMAGTGFYVFGYYIY